MSLASFHCNDHGNCPITLDAHVDSTILIVTSFPLSDIAGSFRFAIINTTTVNILVRRSFTHLVDYVFGINAWIQNC